MSYFSLTNKINFVAPRRNLSAEISISGTDHVSRGCVRRNTNNVRLEAISRDVFSVLIKGLEKTCRGSKQKTMNARPAM